MKSIVATDFDLGRTVASGQLFRFQLIDGWHILRTGRRAFCVRQDKDRILFQGIERARLARFFRLDDDVSSALERLSAEPRLREAIRSQRGLRLVRQDPWECLVSFVSTSCCNIPRISAMLNRLCGRYGEAITCGDSSCRSADCPLPPEWRTVRAFPAPGAFNDELELRRLGFGFRAKYLARISRTVKPAWLEDLRSLKYPEARKRLCTLPGVGPKVADCVLLFSLGFNEAFPVDVHVRSAVQKAYRQTRGWPVRRISDWAQQRFGRNAGLVQQYLFCHERLLVGRW